MNDTNQPAKTFSPLDGVAPQARRNVGLLLLLAVTGCSAPSQIVGTDRSVQQTTAPSLDLRMQSDLDGIVSRGRMSGKEAILELAYLRSSAAKGSLDEAVKGLAVSPGKESSVLDWLDPEAAAADRALALVEGKVRAHLTAYALSTMYDQLTNEQSVLANTFVELPKEIGSFDAENRKRAVNIAALLVLTKVSNKVIKATREDFEKAALSYASLLAKREQATALLVDYVQRLDERRRVATPKTRIVEALTQDEETFLKSLEYSDFARNLQAQNIALDYLRRSGGGSDPSLYKDYRAEADKLVSATNAYLRAAAGGASFAAASAMIAREANRVIKEHPDVWIPMLKFAKEFGSELGELVQISLPAFFIDASDGRFDVYRDGRAVERNIRAKDVVQLLKKNAALVELQDRLFSQNSSGGLLSRVDVCERSNLANFFDIPISKSDRRAYLEGYQAIDLVKERDEEYRFNRYMSGDSDRDRRFRSLLIDADYRPEKSPQGPDRQAAGKTQAKLAENLEKIDDDDFARLILANTEGTPTLARLSVAGFDIRPVPGRDTLRIYEQYQASCLKALFPQATRTPPASGESKPVPESRKKPSGKPPADTRKTHQPAKSKQ